MGEGHTRTLVGRRRAEVMAGECVAVRRVRLSGERWRRASSLQTTCGRADSGRLCIAPPTGCGAWSPSLGRARGQRPPTHEWTGGGQLASHCFGSGRSAGASADAVARGTPSLLRPGLPYKSVAATIAVYPTPCRRGRLHQSRLISHRSRPRRVICARRRHHSFLASPPHPQPHFTLLSSPPFRRIHGVSYLCLLCSTRSP